MPNIGILGGLGSGKTMCLNYLITVAMNQGREVHSNFTREGVIPLERITEIDELQDCLIIIDDIPTILHGRNAMAQTVVAQMFIALRKLNKWVFYSSQISTGADIGLRGLTNLVIETYEIEFPVFGLDVYDPATGFLDNYEIKYLPETYDSYETLEIVSQKMYYKDLLEIYNDLPEKQVFSNVLNLEYNIPKNVSVDIFTCLKLKQERYIPKILKRAGYVLVKK